MAVGKLRVAVIGCGYWGGNYVRVFSELDGVEVVAICDQRQSMVERFRVPGSDVILTTDASAAIKSGVDAVIVCTQASYHYSIAMEALELGKHVLVEKPLTTSSIEARELTATANARGLILMVGHTFMFNSAVRILKQYVDGDDLGDLYYLYSRRTNLGPIRSDVNALWDLAAHDISIFNYLVGSAPKWVNATGVKVLGRDKEDAGFATLGYANGINAHVHVSWADPHKSREIVLVGSRQRVMFDDLSRLEKIRIFQKGVRLVSGGEQPNYGEDFQMRDGDIVSPSVPAAEPLKEQCRDFLRCIRDGKRPVSGGVEGEAVVSTLEAIDTSMSQDGVRVAVNASEEVEIFDPRSGYDAQVAV